MSSKSQPEKFGTPSVNLKLKGNSNTNSNTYQIPHQSESECLTQTETLGLSDGARLHQTAQTRAPAIISSDWNDTLLNGSQHQHEHDFYVDPKSKTTTDAETVSCKCLNVSFKISNLSLVLDKDDGQPQDKGGFPQFDPRSEFFSNSESAFIQNSKKLVGHSSNEYSHTLIESLLEKPVKLVSGESEDPQVAIAYLIVTKEFHGWVMYTCFNCKTMTHAVSRVPGTGENQSKHIYVNYGIMLKPSQQQEVISANPNYSKLFRIVTYPSTGITSKPSTLKPSVVDLLRDVEERSVDYVEEERDNMKRRIREYEAEQLAKFKDLQNVVASNRQNIERQIWAVFKEANEDADSAYEKSVEEIEEISDNLGNLPRHSNINGGKIYAICLSTHDYFLVLFFIFHSFVPLKLSK